uniref:Uncharacterized protein n=1 Tax=Anguilla anguilla TaxID=7936 RepID=A0A0E9WDU2_ANGAN
MAEQIRVQYPHPHLRFVSQAQSSVMGVRGCKQRQVCFLFLA